MIKNAITYSVEMPSANEMLEFTDEYMSAKPEQSEIIKVGFAHHPITNGIVSEFNGGYCLAVLVWEKKLNSAAINQECKERCDGYDLGRPLTKKEKQQVKDEVVYDAVMTTLPTPKYIFAYYHKQSKTLIVDASTSKHAGLATSLLREAIGSLKATTLYIDSRIGLTQSLNNHVKNGDDFINDYITLGNSLELRGQEGKVKYSDINLVDSNTAKEISDQIEQGGMSIKEVELVFNGQPFMLTNEFKMKRMRFDIEVDKESKHEDWLTESFYCCEFITSVVGQLVERFQVVEAE